MGTPTNTLLDRVPTLLVADTVTLGIGADLQLLLAKNAFTPSPALVMGDIVEADFTGYAAKGVSTPTWGSDPATGNRVIALPGPVGGFHWETNDAVNLPQSIFGWALFNADTGDIYDSDLLDTPVVLTAANQIVDLGSLGITLPSGFIQ